MRRLFPYLFVSVLAFLLGLAVFYGFSRPATTNVEEQVSVLYNQIEKVQKLVTVEGSVSEYYNRSEDRTVTLYLPLPARFSFNKQAFVEVSGKVLVGYDLSEINVDIDGASKTVRLSNLPEPEILAIDHDVTFKNLDESWFNEFTAEDFSKLNRDAKQKLRDSVPGSDLMRQAREQGNSVVETIRFLAEAMGFKVILEEGPVLE